MSEYLSKAQIADAIEPYKAVDAVINELKIKGFIVGYGFQGYKITPLGRESDNHFMEAIKEKEDEIADRKLMRVQLWVSIGISSATLIVTIISLFA